MSNQNRALEFTQNNMCYPPFDRSKDMFEQELSFAQALRNHIEFAVTTQKDKAEDPSFVYVY